MYRATITVDARAAAAGDALPALVNPARGSAFLGLLVLLVGLPLLAGRVFVWAVARDIRRAGIVAAIVGDAARRR